MNFFMQLSYFMVINLNEISTYTILICGIQALESDGTQSLRAKRKFKVYIIKQQRFRP